MDTVIADVVTESATKINLDKKFFAGVAVGITASAAAVGVNKLRQVIKAKRAEKALENELAK